MIKVKENKITFAINSIDDLEEYFFKKTALTRLVSNSLGKARISDIAEILDLIIKIELEPEMIANLELKSISS